MMAKFYLSQQTLVSVMALPPKANMRSLLETVSAAGEFSSFRFRQGEKALLTKVNKVRCQASLSSRSLHDLASRSFATP